MSSRKPFQFLPIYIYARAPFPRQFYLLLVAMKRKGELKVKGIIEALVYALNDEPLIIPFFREGDKKSYGCELEFQLKSEGSRSFHFN